MSGQITFFEKNYIDLEKSGVGITVTDSVATNTGESFINYIRNRNNSSGWATTASSDAASTTLIVDYGDEKPVTTILLILHNFKSFTVKYWNGSTYTDFSTAINETSNTNTTNYYSFTEVTTSKVQIIINGTMVADDDKTLRQLIITDLLGVGQLEGWPEIKAPEIGLNKIVNKMLSGKVSVIDQVESFKCQLSVSNWSSDTDLTIIESVFFNREGVLIYLNGGDSDQFSSSRIGYRPQDIYLVRAVNSWKPEWAGFLYKSGIKVDMKLQEANT